MAFTAIIKFRDRSEELLSNRELKSLDMLILCKPEVMSGNYPVFLFPGPYRIES